LTARSSRQRSAISFDAENEPLIAGCLFFFHPRHRRKISKSTHRQLGGTSLKHASRDYVVQHAKGKPDMMQADAELGYQFEPESTATAELQALIHQQRRALRLSDNHYLVHWRAQTHLWCVIDMAALDGHAACCEAFRLRQYCVHLDLISQLCSQESAAGC
jgi:hypothetical protein